MGAEKGLSVYSEGTKSTTRSLLFTKKRLLIFAVMMAAVLALGGWQAVQSMKDAARTYMYGYPIVLMDVTRQVMTDPRTGKAPTNHFPMFRSFPITFSAKWCVPTMTHSTRSLGWTFPLNRWR